MTSVEPARRASLLPGSTCRTAAQYTALRAVISLGKERNQHRRVAVSLRKLFRGENWLRTHTLEGAMLSTDQSGRNET